MYAYNETRNFIGIRGRGVKIITLPRHHEPTILVIESYFYGIKYRCSNRHWQDCPFIMYPSLQMQLLEPLVLVQLALASQT